MENGLHPLEGCPAPHLSPDIVYMKTPEKADCLFWIHLPKIDQIGASTSVSASGFRPTRRVITLR